MAPTLQSHLTLFLLCPYISSCKDSFTLDVQSIASSSTINIKSSPPSFPLVTPNKVLRSNFSFSPIMLSCLKSLVVPIVFGSFPGGSVVKSMPANAGDVGSIPGLGRPLGEGNDNLLQYSCLENLIDKGAWWATVYGVTRVRHDSVAKPPPSHCIWSLVSLPYCNSLFPILFNKICLAAFNKCQMTFRFKWKLESLGKWNIKNQKGR